MNRNRPLCAALLLLCACAPLQALEDDRRQPITLKAGRVELNQKSGVSRYDGNVELQQGSLSIQASSIVVRTTRNEVTRIEADGTPVRIRQRPAPDREEVRAEANHIDYDPKRGVAQLRGKAHLWQEGNEFSGETITYEFDKGLVKANGSSDAEKGRVQMVIQPRKEPTP